MRYVALAVAACLLLACSPGGSARRAGAAWGPIRVNAEAVQLLANGPAEPRLGDFQYAGGAALTSPDTPRFGGFSDIRLLPGGELLAISDEGSLLRARIRLDRGGDLTGLDQARIEPLPGPGLRRLRGKQEGDSEGLAIMAGGDLLVSFERRPRIWLYPARGLPPHGAPAPNVTTPANLGMEALAAAPAKGPDAYWVGIEAGSIWLCRLHGGCERWQGLPGPPDRGFRLKSMAETPSGDLALLHHLYDETTGVTKASVSILEAPKAPSAAPALKARLWLEPPVTVENFEGLAVGPAPNGGLRLYLLSDDNFSAEQRTLLMAFDWSPARSQGADLR